MDERRRIISYLDDLLEQIFQDHTIPSQYQKFTEGKNQCLNFPKANDDWWEGCAKAMHSTEQRINMRTPILLAVQTVRTNFQKKKNWMNI